MDSREKTLLLFLIVLLTLPLFVSGYWVRVFSSVFMLTSLALAQNVLLGFTGYPAFGAIAFFGVGGYSTAILMKSYGFPFLPSLIAGALVSTALALILAPLLMRLKSHYFAITTLALQLALGEVVANLEFTGGAHGINLPVYEGAGGLNFFFYLFWLVMVGSFLINIYVDRSTFGWALKAIREDEISAETLGVNTVKFKSLSFAIMGGLTGIVGGIYAYWITYIDPTSMFDPLLSVKLFVALLIGGVGTTIGPVIGAFGIELVSEIVWGKFFELHGVVMGLLIILLVSLLPKGIMGVRKA